MLPKVNRLRKKKNFEQIFRKGKEFKEKFLFIKAIENNLKESRFSFIVSRKVSKKATIRNKIRRKMREEIRSRLPFIKKGFDIILIFSPKGKSQDFREMTGLIDKLFQKAKIFK